MNALAKKALLITRVKSRPERDGYCEGGDWSAQRAHQESVDITRLVCLPRDEVHIHTDHSDMFAHCGSIFYQHLFSRWCFSRTVTCGAAGEVASQVPIAFWPLESCRPSFRANTEIWHIKNSEYWPTQSPSPLYSRWNIHFVTTFLLTQWRLKWRSTLYVPDATSMLLHSHPASFKFTRSRPTSSISAWIRVNLELLNDPNQSKSAAQCWQNARRNKRTLKKPPAFSKAGPESEVLTSTERSKTTIKAAHRVW